MIDGYNKMIDTPPREVKIKSGKIEYSFRLLPTRSRPKSEVNCRNTRGVVQCTKRMWNGLYLKSFDRGEKVGQFLEWWEESMEDSHHYLRIKLQRKIPFQKATINTFYDDYGRAHTSRKVILRKKPKRLVRLENLK